MFRYVLILFLLLSGCATECQHDHTFRRFIQETGYPMRGNLLCRDCGASVVSFVYGHPWRGPPDGIHGNDELLKIGGWEVVDSQDSKLSEDSK